MSKKVYIGGHCLNRGGQLQRSEEAQMVRELGHDIYCPQENKEINDKSNAVQEALAERIVSHDTDAILWSDTVIIEPDNCALGTHIELGQLLGMRDLSEMIVEIANTHFENNRGKTEDLDYLLISEILKLCMEQLNRKVYPHLEDIRLLGPTGDGYRSTFGINAYVTGACIKLANDPVGAPDGFYTIDQIKKELS
jgi:hypothetical protein